MTMSSGRISGVSSTGVSSGRLAVDGLVVRSEPHSVTRRAVEHVVDPLRDTEERVDSRL